MAMAASSPWASMAWFRASLVSLRPSVPAGHDGLRTAAHGRDALADLALAGQARADAARRLRIAALLQVQAGAEGVARALQHHNAHVAPPVEAHEELAQLRHQAARQGV